MTLRRTMVVVLCLGWTAPACAGVGATVSADSRVIGYYPSWVGDEYPPEKIDYAKFTFICHAFLPVDKDGTPRFEGTVPSRTLTGLAHAAGVKVLLSFGGSGSGRRYNAFAASPAKRKKFIDGALKILEQYGYDGLDNDWEFPENAADRNHYATFDTEVRQGLDRLEKTLKRKLYFTAALTNGNWYGQWYPAEVIARTCDFVNIMTYDYAGEWGELAGHNAPLMKSSRDPDGASVSGTMAYWAARGIPKVQLNLGLANYGRGFDVAEPYLKTAKDAKPSKVGELDYRDAVKLLEAGWTRKWDLETSVPWLYAPDGTQVFGYDDPESQVLKVQWGKREGCGGIFFWDMHADGMPDGSHPLTDASVKAWRE